MATHDRVRASRILLEGSVIVVSILLAFAVDAAWDWRQERQREVEHLTAFREEVVSGLGEFPRTEGIFVGVKHAHESLIDQFGGASLAPADSLFLWLSQLSRPAVFDAPRAVLSDLLSSGGIQLVRSDPLRLAIAEYQLSLSQLDRAADHAWATWAERIQPYLEPRVPRVERLRQGSYGQGRTIPFDRSPFTPDFDVLFTDPAFESMLAERWIRVDSSMNYLYETRAVMEEILELIDDAIG